MRKLAIIAALLTAVPVSFADARVINIPADYPAIQAGINASVNGDTVLVHPGTYIENINFNGHNITLGSLFLIDNDSMRISSTIIDGNAQGSVIILNHSEDSTAAIIGLTLRNGCAGAGSGIFCEGASPAIRHNIITGNSETGTAGEGAGICCMNSSNASISHNRVVANRGGFGGGIATHNSSPVISNNIIVGNRAVYGEMGGNGGGIFCNGLSVPVIIGNSILSDTADWSGGGISCISNTQALIVDNLIENNIGGGIQLSVSNSIVLNNIISENRDQYDGGGISCYLSGTIIGNTIISNTAGRNGGGISAADFAGSLRNNVIIRNSASEGGGIHCHSPNEAPSIGNNVVYGNSSGIYCEHLNPAIFNSIFWDNETYEIASDTDWIFAVNYCDVEGGWPGRGNLNFNPLFRDTTNNNFRLMSLACGDAVESPCIDAGDPGLFDGLLDCSWGLGTPRSDMGAYGGGDSLIIGIDEPQSEIPDKFLISQNYPNPFNAQTTIQYSLPTQSMVSIDIFDLLGRKIGTLAESIKPVGNHQAIWDASGQSSGIYFYRIKAGDKIETKTMMLMK